MDNLVKELQSVHDLYARSSEDSITRIVLIQNDYTIDKFKEERNLLSTTLEEARMGKFINNPQRIRDVLDIVRNHSHIIRAAEGHHPVIPHLKSIPGKNFLHEMILNRLYDFEDKDIDNLDDHQYNEMMSLATLADIADKSLSQETSFKSCLFYQNKAGSRTIRTPLRLLRDIGFLVKLFPDGTFITNGMIYVKVLRSATYGKLTVLHVDPDHKFCEQTNMSGLKLTIPEDHDVQVMGNVSSETIAKWVDGNNSPSSNNIGVRMVKNLRSDKREWIKNGCGSIVYGYQKLKVRGRTISQSVNYLEVKSGRILNKTAHAKVTWLSGVHVSASPEIFWSRKDEWSEPEVEKICNLSAVQIIIAQALDIRMDDAEDYASFFLLANNWFNSSAGAVNETNGCAYRVKDQGGVEVKPVSWKVCEAVGWSFDSIAEKIYSPSPHLDEYSVTKVTRDDRLGYFDVENKKALVPHNIDARMKFGGN